VLELAHGDVLDLTVGPMPKLGEGTVRMLGYNGSVPAPPSRSTRAARSSSRSPTRVTWTPPCTGTGCLENRYHGVPHETQTPIPVGGEFTYPLAHDSRSLRTTMAQYMASCRPANPQLGVESTWRRGWSR
jgi:hypothetical protein